MYFWIRSGTFKKSSIAEHRIERVKVKYREIRAGRKTESEPEMVSELISSKVRTPLTPETQPSRVTSGTVVKTEIQAEAVTTRSIASRQAKIQQAGPRPTSSHAIHDKIPQVATEVIESSTAPEVPGIMPTLSTTLGEAVVPQTAAQSALTGVAPERPYLKSRTQEQKILPGFYRGLFALRKPKTQDQPASETIVTDGVSNQITIKNDLRSSDTENVVEAPVAVLSATSVNPVIEPIKGKKGASGNVTEDVTTAAT